MAKKRTVISAMDRRLLTNQMEALALSNGIRKEMFAVMEQVRTDLLTRLNAFPKSTTLSKQFVQRVLIDVDAQLLVLSSKYKAIIESGQRALILNEFNTIAAALVKDIVKSSGLAAATIRPELPVRQVEAILGRQFGGKKLDTWLKGHTRSVRQTMQRSLAASLVKGENIVAASAAVRTATGLSRKASSVIARTALLTAASRSREQVYKKLDKYIESYTYLATLDDSTCLVCAPDDGRTEENRSDLPGVPRHPNCRCLIRANTSLAEPIDRPAVVSTNRRVVHHRDGSTSTVITPDKVVRVDSSVTYADFFKSQPAAWQKEVLGARRYQLYKSGNLDLKDLRTTGTNKVLTVKQLERRVG